jgi:hypothetical protein
MSPLRSEPVLAAEVAASTRANVLAWAAGIARDPGGRVPANLTPEVLGIAREAFRRGIEQTVYTTYQAWQNVGRRTGCAPRSRYRRRECTLGSGQHGRWCADDTSGPDAQRSQVMSSTGFRAVSLRASLSHRPGRGVPHRHLPLVTFPVTQRPSP